MDPDRLMQTRDAEQVSCPHCQAGAGRPCTRGTGHAPTPHSSRVRAFHAEPWFAADGDLDDDEVVLVLGRTARQAEQWASEAGRRSKNTRFGGSTALLHGFDFETVVYLPNWFEHPNWASFDQLTAQQRHRRPVRLVHVYERQR